ncbi:MAG: hypothetical protein WDN25_25855 [Acetobacteraceae bacterium]
MMTRTLGTVTGATVLMLLFQTMGFGATFYLAATLPMAVVLLGLLRGWARR